MEGPRFAASVATIVVAMPAALLWLAGCDAAGGGHADAASDGASSADAASDGAAERPDAGSATSKAIGLSACGALAPHDFCLLDPPYAGVWTDAPDDVWIIESDFQEVTARHFDGARWTAFAAGSDPLAAIWGSGPRDVWAVGAAGAIQHWDGATWAPSASPTAADLNAVWGSAPDDVWAAGTTPGSPTEAATLHWDGSVWSAIGCCGALAGQSLSLVALSGHAADDVWAVGAVRPTADADPAPLAIHWDGTRWTTTAIAGSDFGLTSVASLGSNDVWFGARRQLLHDDGTTLTSTSILGTITALGGSATSDLWAAASGGGLYHFDGASWSPIASGTSNDLVSVAASGAGDGWAVGPAGTVLGWNGVGWSALTDGSRGPLEAVSGSDPSGVWTTGPLHFDGDGWSHDAAGSSIVATGLCGLSAGDFWAVGQTLSAGNGNGFIAHFDGAGWTIDGIAGIYLPVTSAAPSLGPSSMNALWCHTPSDVWAVGQITAITGPVENTVAHWDGSVWSPVDVPSTQFLAGVWGSAADDVWAAGGVGTLLHWNGSAWTLVASNVTDDLGAVWGSAADDVWVTIAHQPELLHWDGQIWSSVPDGAGSLPMAALWGTSATDVWAVGGDDATGGAVVHWDGSVWSTVWSVPAAIGKLTGVWGSGPDLYLIAEGGSIFVRR
jgi:hypothetical protein